MFGGFWGSGWGWGVSGAGILDGVGVIKGVFEGYGERVCLGMRG